MRLPSAERPAGGLDRPQQVAGREIGRIGTAPELIDRRAATARIELEVAAADQRRLGHETAGQQHAIAGDLGTLPSAVRTSTPFDAAAATNLDQLGAEMDGDAEQARKQHQWRADAWAVRRPRSSPRAGCRPAGR